MKWKKFMDAVEKAGIKDDDEIWYIDFSFDDEIVAIKDPSLGWSIS